MFGAEAEVSLLLNFRSPPILLYSNLYTVQYQYTNTRLVLHNSTVLFHIIRHTVYCTVHSFQLYYFFLYFFAPTTTTGGGDCTRYGRRKTRNRYTSPGFRDSEEQRFLSSYSSRSFSYSVLIFLKTKRLNIFYTVN